MARREQQNAPMMHVPLAAVYAQRHMYVIPEFQRDFIWPHEKQAWLVDTVLRGWIVPAITLTTAFEGGRRIFKVIDGQQRLYALLSFMDNEYATLTEMGLRNLDPTPGLLPIAPYKKYKHLPPDVRDDFETYMLSFTVSPERSAEETAAMFRRMQGGMGLTTGEGLHSYAGQSRIADMATVLRRHPMWRRIYAGKDNHRQIYHQCLMCLGMELLAYPADMSPYSLRPLAAGAFDERLKPQPEGETPEIQTHVEHRLTAGVHLFGSSKYRAIGDIIAIYQAVQKLESRGVNLMASRPNCLSAWFESVIQHVPVVGPDGLTTYSKGGRLISRPNQEQFWGAQLTNLMRQAGLVYYPGKAPLWLTASGDPTVGPAAEARKVNDPYFDSTAITGR